MESLDKISKRCGKGTRCEFYDKNNQISKCSLFDDRRNCPLSMQNRKRAATKSKNRDTNSSKSIK